MDFLRRFELVSMKLLKMRGFWSLKCLYKNSYLSLSLWFSMCSSMYLPSISSAKFLGYFILFTFTILSLVHTSFSLFCTFSGLSSWPFVFFSSKIFVFFFKILCVFAVLALYLLFYCFIRIKSGWLLILFFFVKCASYSDLISSLQGSCGITFPSLSTMERVLCLVRWDWVSFRPSLFLTFLKKWGYPCISSWEGANLSSVFAAREMSMVW